MPGDAIRSEVVQIGWEIEDSPFAEIEKQLEEIVKFADSFVNNVADEFVKLAQQANVATDDFTKLKEQYGTSNESIKYLIMRASSVESRSIIFTKDG